jgi:hypothetical protein
VSEFGKVYERVVAELDRNGMFRAKDLASHGLSPGWLKVLIDRRWVTWQEPGVYVAAKDAPLASRASVKWPGAVITGLSAVHAHGWGPEPKTLWIAFDHQARVPKTRFPMAAFRCRNLANDPHRQRKRHLSTWINLFSLPRAIVDALRWQEHAEAAVLSKVVSDAIGREAVSLRQLLALARARGCERIIEAALQAALAVDLGGYRQRPDALLALLAERHRRHLAQVTLLLMREAPARAVTLPKAGGA